MAPYVTMLAVVGIFYAAVSSTGEFDLKRFIAQTSIAHMNMLMIGLCSADAKGLYGAFHLTIGHAVTAAALFFGAGVVYDKLGTRDITCMGGLVMLMPLYASFMFFFLMANAGFPCSLSFVGEFMILMSAAKSFSILTYVVLIVSATCLLYANVRIFIAMFFGNLNKDRIPNTLSDFTHLELFCALFLVFSALTLMIDNDFYFYIIYHELMMRYIS